MPELQSYNKAPAVIFFLNIPKFGIVAAVSIIVDTLHEERFKEVQHR